MVTGRPGYGPCYNRYGKLKRKYPTESTAEKMAIVNQTQYGGERMTAYLCPQCEFYHLSSPEVSHDGLVAAGRPRPDYRQTPNRM